MRRFTVFRLRKGLAAFIVICLVLFGIMLIRAQRKEPKLVFHLPFLSTHVAFSPNGKVLLTTSIERKIIVWNATNGDQIKEIETSEPQGKVVFSPIGRFVATLSDGTDTVSVWDTLNWEKYREIKVGGRLLDAAYSPDGHFLVTTGYTQDQDSYIYAYLWNMDTGEKIDRILWEPGHTGLSMPISYSPDGKFVAISHSPDEHTGITDIWNTLELRVTIRFEMSSAIVDTTWSPDGKFITSGNWDSKLRIWDIDNIKESMSLSLCCGGIVNSVAYSPDGHYIIAGGDGIATTLWDVTTWTQVAVLNDIESGGSIEDITYSFNGNFVAVSKYSRYEKTTDIWDLSAFIQN